MFAQEAERLYQTLVLLQDSGDITPQGAMMIRKVIMESTL